METPLEYILTHTYKADMLAYMASHPEAFKEAFQLAISDKQPYAWRSAWLLWGCITKNDMRIRPHIDAIINSLSTKKDGHTRELLKILDVMELNELQEGIIYNLCINLWKNIHKTPSIRYTAIKFIFRMVHKHPALWHEVRFLTQDIYVENLTPGIKKGVEKLTINYVKSLK